MADFSLELVAGAEGFGNGEHPTTQLALQALHVLTPARPASRILDMGCGAGLLAMAAAHLWAEARVLAADIETSAVETARQNIRHNGLEARIRTARANSYRDRQILAAAPYDLVLANITADTLIALAAGIRPILAEKAVVILSGCLRWRSMEVLATYAQCGLHPILPTLAMGEWDTHVLGTSQP